MKGINPSGWGRRVTRGTRLLLTASACALAGHSVLVEAAAPGAYRGPLADIGDKLNDAGFYPNVFIGEWYISNPSAGVHEGSHQWMTQVNAGFDYYLEPLTGLKGTSIHFMEGYVPWITHQTALDNYFTQAGDVINGSASGYVPIKAHLTRFTLEQELFDKHLFIEGGKGYVNDYVARPDCLNAFQCMSTIAITHKASGFNFPNYSNWFGRVGYNVSPTVKVQGMWYQYDNNASQTNGWEDWRPSNYSAYLVDLQYNAQRTARPAAAEIMGYYNKIPQTDQLCATCDKDVTNWQGGIFASGMQTLWRPEPASPKMLQAFVSVGTAFNEKQTTSPSVGGMNYALDTGLTMHAPFKSRPLDSYSLQLTMVQLTKDEQTYLKNQGYGDPGRREYSIGASAFFNVYDYIFVSPYAEYLINANAAFAGNDYVNPTHAQPSDGLGVGMIITIPFTHLLGLSPGRSPYDGHYP
ncbi:carbohydrate porin [Solimonas marina]|uniref:Carbohydrate porin n=1 Tax=Solimonas marina TaxID=2714601 RepID=A0A970BB94_9GAMM|nr:carbohydrate porin [Solimonas marina]NKF24156.1 carbohydrate porin [Solimonas marina]